jgi:hypothetical protein
VNNVSIATERLFETKMSALTILCLLAVANAVYGRSAVLMEYGLHSKHNVKWTTMTNNLVDSNGKPVAASGGDCTDMLGKSRKDGEEYERPNHKFVYKCEKGLEKVVACYGSERAQKARIDVGTTKDIDGFWHKCESNDNGTTVYTEEPSCIYNGKEHHFGEELNIGNLIIKCIDNGYDITGCYYKEGGSDVKLGKGEVKEVNGIAHHCEEKDGELQYFSRGGGGCKKNETQYKEGEEAQANHLRYKCSGGALDVVGCYIDEGKPLNVGQDVVDKGMAHRCYRESGTIVYHEFACGFSGTPSCDLKPIEQGEELPKMAQGPTNEGFLAFSAAGKHGIKLDKETLQKLMAPKMQ